MKGYHWHHIIPKHAGGTDDRSNLILLTIEEHIEAHKRLWCEHGRWEDYYAYMGLSGHMKKDEILLALYMRRRNCKRNSQMYWDVEKKTIINQFVPL